MCTNYILVVTKTHSIVVDNSICSNFICFIGVSLVNKVSFPFHVFKGWCDFSLTGHKICFTEKEKKMIFK